MKKIAFAIACVLLFASTTACQTEIDKEPKNPSSVSIDNPGQPSQGNLEVEVAETVLIDEKGVKITLTGIDEDSFMGPELKILIENSSGKDLTVQSSNTSINGYMIDSILSADVVNGKKVNDTITFMESDFEDCGISAIADIELSFHIFESDSWNTYLDTSMISVKTNIADTYKYEYDDSGEIVYNSEGIKIVVKDLREDSFMGPELLLYIENLGNKNITVQATDVSINDFMTDTIFSADILAGKRAVEAATFLSSDIEENGIEEIKSLDIAFNIFDADNWNNITTTNNIHIEF